MHTAHWGKRRQALAAASLCAGALVLLAAVRSGRRSRVQRGAAPTKTYHQLAWNASLHLYTDNGRPIIWTFYDKRPAPSAMLLSFGTLLCHNEHAWSVKLVYEDEFKQWMHNIHPAFDLLIGAHKADYFRARVLDTYGGIYTDMDTVAMYPAVGLLGHLRRYDLVGMSWRKDNDTMAVGTMGPFRAHTMLTKRWVDRVHSVLDNKLRALKRHHEQPDKFGYPLRWGELLRNIIKVELAKLVDQRLVRYYSYDGMATAGQLVAYNVGFQMALKSVRAPVALREAPFIFWHHSYMAKHYGRFDALSFRQLMDSDYILVEAVAAAYAKCRNKTEAGRSQRRGAQPMGKPARLVLNHWRRAGMLYREDESLRAWICGYLRTRGILLDCAN